MQDVRFRLWLAELRFFVHRRTWSSMTYQRRGCGILPAHPRGYAAGSSSSGEMMALYAASNIAQAIRGFGKRGYARLCGIILNARNIEGEREIVRRAAEEIGTDVVAYVPRSGDIQRAEAGGGTVFECLEDSPMRAVYEDLAGRVLDLTHDEKGEQQVC
ncbi:MAG: hypothetical protein ACLUI3_12985 [Christensenellales bacterium]